MQSPLENFFNHKRVLITGHTGFKGSWLTLWLLNLGADIAGYSLEPSTNPSMFNILNLTESIDHTISDIRDAETLKKVILKFRPDIIFHLAAQPLVRYSYFNPAETFETNVIGTVNLLDAARLCDSVKAVICITSDKCYKNREWVYGYRENDPMGGYDPYSASKGCSELVISSYRNTYFNPEKYGRDHNVALASTRAGNVIGGGDWSADRLIPDCVKFITNKQDIVLRNPDATRPWQHVLEPLYGYLMLAKKLHEEPVKYSEGWNFGPGDSDTLPVRDVVTRVIQNWGEGSVRIEKDADIHEANMLKLDISKARAILKWKPVLTIDQAIDKTISWYKTFYNYGDMREISLKQIDQYLKLTH